MAALNFPTPSAVGEVYTANNASYTWDGVSWVNNSLYGIPSQTGNGGRFLTTDGTSLSWGDVDLAGVGVAMAIALG